MSVSASMLMPPFDTVIVRAEIAKRSTRQVIVLCSCDIFPSFRYCFPSRYFIKFPCSFGRYHRVKPKFFHFVWVCRATSHLRHFMLMLHLYGPPGFPIDLKMPVV